MMTRLGTVLFCTSIAISSSAFAQPTLYVAGYGGSFQVTMQKSIIPAFEAKNNVKVVYVPGRSVETVAKLQAQKSNEEINVAIADDGPMYQAVQYGLCDPLANSPVYEDIYKAAAPAAFGGKAVGVGLVATGIVYNTKVFKEKGWAPPTSWKDLTDPKFKQRVASSPISGTYGLHALVMFARMNGGGEHNIQPGFEAIRKNLSPNVFAWTSNNQQLENMFQGGDVVIAVWGTIRATELEKTGVPVKFVYPKEGAVALTAAVCPVVHNKLPKLSQAFVQYLMSPEVQAKLATLGFGPTNSKTKLSAELAAEVPYGTEKISKLQTVDWNVINRRRAAWTDEWNRTVER
jgi:putative spermidine/putrescine transport system substrate-binding protein